jgi:hypothetical protein
VTPSCYAVTFTRPVDQAQLSAADDKNGDQCGDGFQYDVTITTSAPNGTSVLLFGDATMLATATASGGSVTFPNVQLASGSTVLSIQFPSTTPCTDASTKAKVTVDCSVPTCTVSKPIVSATHPVLNGVPSGLGGDRSSSSGSPYEVAFEVTTNIADNQTVALDVTGITPASATTTVTAHASGGKAAFAGVPLPNDGTYEVQARCIDGHGVVGLSAKGTYPVDTVAPDLTVSKPASGDFIGPSGLTNGSFSVCGMTTSTDAAGLEAALGAGQSNYCVTTTGSPICKPVTAVGVDTCVDVACPGDAPFNITVTLTDRAGNPHATVLSNITCSSSTPTVQIVTPVTDAPTFTDPSRHLLSASAAQAFVDKNGAVAGAQTDVVACTSRAGTATLFAGHTGDPSLTQIAAAVTTSTATVTDGCPNGLGFVARFSSVTLPESVETATGALATATELRVDVTDTSSSTGQSAPLDLWVDSVAPTIALATPANLCGSFHQAFATYDTSLIFTTDTPNVTATITNGSATDTLTSPTFSSGTATFSTVSFAIGQNNLAAIAKDPAGNSTAMQPSTCAVTVGMAPVVLFTSPLSTNKLCPSSPTNPANCIDDLDPVTNGWQGAITVQALVNGLPLSTGNITFSVGNIVLGSAPLDATGHATLSNVTLSDGSVTITAQTDNIPGNGVGVGQLTVIVDLGPPNAPTAPPVTVPPTPTIAVKDRRETSFTFSWTTPSDTGGGTIAGYDVRYSRTPITDDTTFNAATRVPYTGSPTAAGTLDSITIGHPSSPTDTTNPPLNIETDYYFAVKAVDAAGNLSAMFKPAAAIRAEFKVTVLSGTGTDNSGFDLNGSGDVGTSGTNGFASDGHSDLIVGATAAKHVYAYFGSENGPSTTPSITFTGGSQGFGRSVALVDIDGDKKDDIAISSPNDNGGRVYIYSRKSPKASWNVDPLNPTWPATLSDADASYVISTPATVNGVISGRGVQPIGDFDGDGNDDLAISYSASNSSLGAVIVIKGGSSFPASMTPDATNSILINGTAAGGAFGVAVVGIGQFYGPTSPSTFVSTASIVGTSYSFTGVSPVGGVATASAADDSTVGSASDRYGTPIAYLGPLGPSPGAVALAALGNTASGYVELHLGTTASGPFLGTTGGAPTGVVRLRTSQAGNSFGVVNIGSGIRGKSLATSFIGGLQDNVPDLVLAQQAETGNRLYLVNGNYLTTLSGTVDLSASLTGNIPGVVQVNSRLPGDWSPGYTMGALIIDIDKDGVADFAIGEAVSSKPGRVAVFY